MSLDKDIAVLEVTSQTVSKINDKHCDVLGAASRSQSRGSLADFSASLSYEGSVVASPSIESFSSIADQEASICDPEFIKDIKVHVDNPQKHVEPLETYITFRVATKTNRSEYPQSESIVRRRYNDFVWLHSKLIESLPSYIIPPLPEKHSFLENLNRYSKDFIVCRMKLLDLFLKRVTSHPVIGIHPHVVVFLTAKLSEYNIYKKNSPLGLINKMSESFYNLTNIYSMRYHSPEFENVSNYISNLYDKISYFEKIGARLHKERKEYISEVHQFVISLNNWATIEPQLSPFIRQVSNTLETSAVSYKSLLIDPFFEYNSHPMRDYLLYIDAVKQVLGRRDQIQIEYDVCVEVLQKKKSEKEMLTNNETSTTSVANYSLWKSTSEDRLEKLSTAIPKLTTQLEIFEEKLQKANENLRSDLERWKLEKKNDLKKILLKIADQQIAYYQQNLGSWEGVLVNLNA